MSFLPEDDQEYLKTKTITHELLTEKVPDGTERRAVLFPGFAFAGDLRTLVESQLVASSVCDLLVIIPAGYATTKLDCFYTSPHLKRADGTDPSAATSQTEFFERKWQLWSRHLDEKDWRTGIDGLGTYLAYVRRALQTA